MKRSTAYFMFASFFEYPIVQRVNRRVKVRTDRLPGSFIQYKTDLDRTIESSAWRFHAAVNAVEFFKDKMPPVYSAKDSDRRKLLFLKQTLALNGENMTIRQVAEYLAGGRVKTPADGFSAIRRKCKQLGISIKPSRKIKKK